MKFIQYDEQNEAVATASSHIEKQEDGTFKLIWTRTRPLSKDYIPVQSRVKLDVVRPGRR